VCVNVERAHVTSACCYLEITARKCRSFEEEEKGICASVKKKLSSMRGLPFPSLREVVVVSKWWFPWSWSLVGSLICQLEEKIKKFVRVLLLLNTTCALFVLYCTLVIYIHK
jgi:hypothetical protein